MQKALIDRNKVLESENLKLREENEALKKEVLRLKLENKQLKNQNKDKRESDVQINKINKKLITELSLIQDENTLKIEDIPNTSLYLY